MQKHLSAFQGIRKNPASLKYAAVSKRWRRQRSRYIRDEEGAAGLGHQKQKPIKV